MSGEFLECALAAFDLGRVGRTPVALRAALHNTQAIDAD
jgi:hypothetical protein